MTKSYSFPVKKGKKKEKGRRKQTKTKREDET